MAGAMWGLLLGLGLASIWWSFWPSERGARPRRDRRRIDRLRDEIVLAGIRGLGPWTLIGLTLALALASMLLVFAVTGVWTVSLCFAGMANSNAQQMRQIQLWMLAVGVLAVATIAVGALLIRGGHPWWCASIALASPVAMFVAMMNLA